MAPRRKTMAAVSRVIPRLEMVKMARSSPGRYTVRVSSPGSSVQRMTPARSTNRSDPLGVERYGRAGWWRRVRRYARTPPYGRPESGTGTNQRLRRSRRWARVDATNATPRPLEGGVHHVGSGGHVVATVSSMSCVCARRKRSETDEGEISSSAATSSSDARRGMSK